MSQSDMLTQYTRVWWQLLGHTRTKNSWLLNSECPGQLWNLACQSRRTITLWAPTWVAMATLSQPTTTWSHWTSWSQYQSNAHRLTWKHTQLQFTQKLYFAFNSIWLRPLFFKARKLFKYSSTVLLLKANMHASADVWNEITVKWCFFNFFI